MKRILLSILLTTTGVTSFATQISVTNTNDSGAGSLRDAIANSAANDTIVFSLTYPNTITLTSGTISIGNNLTIMGTDPSQLTISGGGTLQIFTTSATVNFIGLTLSDAYSSGGWYGSAISVNSSSYTTNITNCIFENNINANAGAAIKAWGNMLIDSCTFRNNTASSGSGGAILVIEGTTGTITNSTFYNNTATNGNGGAISINNTPINISNCTFTSNSSTYSGGAIEFNCGACMFPAVPATLTITNSTFSDNSATNNGSEIAVNDNVSSLTFNITNSIINNSTGGINFYSTGTNVSGGSNICSDGTMAFFLTNTGDLNNTDPLLGTFGNYGGPTQTFPIDCSSPAYNAGTATGAPTYDQRHMPRYSIVDIGAFEAQPLYGTDTRTACNSYTWIDGNVYTTNNNTATDTLLGGAVNGCDSIVTLDLTINSVSDVTTTQNGISITANNTAATAYEWLDCNNNYAVISGETSQSFTASANSSYAVQITENGCVDTSACVAITTVGIIENDFGSELTVYPNPTKGDFSINFGSTYESATVKITDINGRLIESGSFNQTQQLDLTIDQPVGVYLVNVRVGDKKAIIKLIKE